MKNDKCHLFVAQSLYPLYKDVGPSLRSMLRAQLRVPVYCPGTEFM